MGPEMIHQGEPVGVTEFEGRSAYVMAYQHEQGTEPEPPSVMVFRDRRRPAQLSADAARTIADVIDVPDTWEALAELVKGIREQAAAIEPEAG